MRKRFTIKIYELNGTYIKTFSPEIVMNEVEFTMTTNGGQGQCRINLKLPLDDFNEGTVIDHMKVVKVFESDDVNSPTPRLIYTGFVAQYIPYFSKGEEGVTLVLLGLVSMLSLGYYRVGGAYAFNLNIDPSSIMKNIIDHFVSVYPGNWLSYSAGFVDNVGVAIDYDFNNIKWFDAMRKMVQFTTDDWWWHIGADGQLYMRDRPAGATHLLTLGKDVDDIRIQKNNEKIVNRYRLTWGELATTDVYEDATSQSAYGLRERLETDVNTKDDTTADRKGNKLIADFKDGKVEATMQVNNRYDIESIKPGHTVSIRNTKKGSGVLPTNLLITAVRYNPNNVALTLENQLSTFADVFVDAVDAINE